MRKVHLMNSAMMPREGIYHCYRISKNVFCKLLVIAHKKDKLESYIGYPQNVQLIKEWTGIEVELSRKETNVKDGDIMLVMKLKYRLDDPSKKGNIVRDDNFEFYVVHYKERR